MERALRSLLKARDLQPNNMAIRRDLDDVTKFFQQQGKQQQQQMMTRTPQPDDSARGLLLDEATGKFNNSFLNGLL